MFHSAKTALIVLILSFGTLHSSSFAQSLSDADVSELRKEAQDLLVEKMPNKSLAKIEQVIIARPTDLAARFFRSQILVSLGRGNEIKDELQLMTTLNISANDKAKAQSLIEAIDKAERRFSGSLIFKAGYGYGDNVNSWPTGGETTNTAGINAAMGDPIYKKYQPIHDTIATGSMTLRGSVALSKDKSFKTNFSLSTSIKEAGDTVSMNNRINSVRIGLQKDLEAGTSIKANLSATELNRVNDKNGTAVTSDVKYSAYDAEITQKFLDSFTAGLKVANNMSRNSKINNAKNSDSNTTTTSLFIGSSLSKTSYGRFTLSQSQARADLTTEVAKKKVDKDTNAITALYVLALPHNQRIVATLGYSEGKHLKKLINNKKRLDKTTSATISYNVKGETLWSSLSGIDFSIDGTISETESNQASARVAAKTIMVTASKKLDL